MSLIFKTERLVLKIKIPPIIESSTKRLSDIKFFAYRLKKYIEPCHKNKTRALHIIPIPNAQDKIIEVIKSRVALVKRKILL